MALLFHLGGCERSKRHCSFQLEALFLLALISVFFLSATAYSAQVSIGWNPSADPSTIGYKVYYGNQSGDYSWVVDAGTGHGYTVTGLSASLPWYFAVTAYTANAQSGFSPELICYFVTASTLSNGQITPAGATPLASGGSRTFSIVPDAGYEISDVLIDGVSVGAVSQYTLSNVSACHTIVANFTSLTTNPSITTSTLGSGSISPSGTVGVAAGTNQSFTITPAAHYQISDVVVDNASIGPVSSYAFDNVTANHTIAATFVSHNKFHIRSTARGSGSISPSGTVSVAAGTNKAFVIAPAAHHFIADVLVDGISTSPASSGGSIIAPSTYSFAYVSANHIIEAIFSKIPPPVADAGPDQDVINGSTVTLNGSNSTNSVCGIASYEWTQVAGPLVVLSNPLAPICTFAAPNVASAYVLGFVLKVTNNGGISESNLCLINVAATSKAPSANAGPDQIVISHTIVDLNGSGSVDPDDGIASYSWVQLQGLRATVHGAKAADASFEAPHPGPLGASLIFQLQVTDLFGLITRDQCTINVIKAHLPPVASAGSDQNAATLSSVTLDGSGSSDPSGSPVAYRWKQIRGVPVTLSDPTAQNPVFTAPSVSGSQNPDLLFMLTATGPYGLSATAKCTVTVQ